MSATPKIENRSYQDYYQQALQLAGNFCPDWDNAKQALQNLSDSSQQVDPDDPGLVLVELLARLAEILTGQINRIPDKYQLAFYDFIGIDYLPATASRVPLTFLLSSGSQQAEVPERTQVASTADSTVIFETVQALTVLDFNIAGAYSLDPWNDKYTDHLSLIGGSPDGFYIFGGDSGAQSIPHRLYLADSGFNVKTPATVTLHCSLPSGSSTTLSQYFSNTGMDGAGSNILLTITDKDNHITFTNLALPETEINNESGFWLVLLPNENLRPAAFETLKIDELTYTIEASGILPDACLTNDTVDDLKKGFNPFGDQPQVDDAFYIGSDEVFAKKCAKVTLTLSFAVGSDRNVTLAWEYWDGLQWQEFTLSDDDKDDDPKDIKYFIEDDTGNFTDTGNTIIIDNLPEIPSDELSGITSRWIRARITAGGYGQVGGYKQTGDLDSILKDAIPDQSARNNALAALNEAGIVSGFVYSEATYNPPHIYSITLGYIVDDLPVERIETLNGSDYQDITNETFTPFSRIKEEEPSFYMGFGESVGNQQLNLYFSCKPKLSSDSCQIVDPDIPEYRQEEPSGFQWFYFSSGAKDWANLAVVDQTGDLSGSGLIELVIPEDMAKATFFGQELYWFKYSAKDGSCLEPQKLKGVFPNTVWAEQASVHQDERLGSGSGEAGQELALLNQSILKGQIIEVMEPEVPSTGELEDLQSEEGADPVRFVPNEAGDTTEVWVRWHEVETFAHSTSSSRHYQVDRSGGTVRFGDGLRGMLPPVLANNIMAREYKSGGGLAGNQAEEVVTDLKTAIANVQGAINYDGATGGKDIEDNSGVLERAPDSIKNYDRAVTAEDLEALAVEASSNVVRVRSVPLDVNDQTITDCPITVVIATDMGTSPPSTDMGVVDSVRDYLQERAFVGIKDRIEVVGAEYCPIDVTATVVPKSTAETMAVKESVTGAIQLYFDPFLGGAEGTGWQFGQTIYLSKIAALIQETAGVDSISQLKINNTITLDDPSKTGQAILQLETLELPYPGTIDITLVTGELAMGETKMEEAITNAVAITGSRQPEL